MIDSVERFLKVKENTNCTFTIIKGISYIFKHNQQNHACGMVVPETGFYLLLYICLESSITYYTSVSPISFKIMGVEKLVYSYWKSLDLLICTKVTRAIYTPCEKDRLVSRVRGAVTWSEIHFNALDIIPSLPGAPSFNCKIFFLLLILQQGIRKMTYYLVGVWNLCNLCLVAGFWMPMWVQYLQNNH